MNQYVSSSIANVVSLDLESSWAARNLQEAIRQATVGARFQQKQMQEKEEKLLRLYENQQQRVVDRVNGGSAGSNTSATSITSQGGKVRQMFDERRQKAGIDRSYPLEPLKNSKPNGYTRGNSLDRIKNQINNKTIVKSTVKKSVSNMKNGKPIINKKEVIHNVYTNNNGNENYEEIVYQNNDNNNRNGPVLNKTYGQKDLETMLNDFHLNDNIDSEQFPDVDIDEFDEPMVKPKIKLTDEKVYNQKKIISKKPVNQNVNGISREKPLSPSKSEPKPLVKRVIHKSNVTAAERSNTSNSTNNNISVNSSLSNMSAKKDRVPSTARPSSKQSGRGPTSAVNRDDLEGCKYCHRRFATDRLAVHEDICAKTAKKKRKIYDATKHRVEGTELEPYTRKANRTTPSSKPAGGYSDTGNPHSKQQLNTKKSTSKQSQQQQPKKSDWRRKHEEFIGAIRAAKMAQAHVAAGGKLSDLPPPPPSSNPDYVQCPHCGRRFNETAAERHIPKCSTYDYNKPKPGSKNLSGKNVPSYR